MPEDQEYLFAYNHIGRLHNEGITYVMEKLTADKPPEKVTRQKILELVAEYMYLIDCCNADINEFIPQGSKVSKIKYVLYIEFLVNLQTSLKGKSVTNLIKQPDFNAESLTIMEMIINGALDIDESTVNSDMDLQIPAVEMLKYLEKKVIEGNITENEKRISGTFLAVSRASIDYGKNVLGNKILKDRHESVNALAEEITPAPNNEQKKFRWSWKADAEGAIGGLISGGISGALAGPAGVAVNGLLGAVGGSISNSIIKSIRRFRD